jgi:hypothetical protein
MSNQPLPNEQLASLLIDGELTGENLALANQRLQNDAEFAAEVKMLREQRELFKQLPVFKAPDDFPDRILESSIDQIRTIVGDENFPGNKPTPASLKKNKNTKHEFTTRSAEFERKINATYTWRTAIAAVASLAGMILLTLFVFPNGASAPNFEVASITAGSDDDASDQNEASPEFEEFDGVTSKGDFAKADEMEVESDSVGQLGLDAQIGKRQTQYGVGNAAPEPAAPKSEGYAKRSKGDTNVADSIAKAELNSNNAIQEASNAMSGFNKEGFSGTPMKLPSKSAAAAPGSVASAPAQLAAVEQIWYVDLDTPSGTQGAIASVGNILKSNRIEVQYDQANQMNEQLARNGSVELESIPETDQPGARNQNSILKSINNETGFEAFYVVATPGQIKQALIELSEKADISTLPIGVNTAPAQSLAANQSIEIQTVEEQTQQIAVPPTLVMQNDRAMAQQLMNVPLLRGLNEQARSRVVSVPPVPSSNDPALNGLAKSGIVADEDDSADESLQSAQAGAGGSGMGGNELADAESRKQPSQQVQSAIAPRKLQPPRKSRILVKPQRLRLAIRSPSNLLPGNLNLKRNKCKLMLLRMHTLIHGSRVQRKTNRCASI